MTRQFRHLLSVRERLGAEICELWVSMMADDDWGWAGTCRQTTLMLVEDAMMDDPCEKKGRRESRTVTGIR